MKPIYIIVAIITTILITFFATNVLTGKPIENNANPEGLNTIRLQVSIPCPGHAPLIKNELTKAGISSVNYNLAKNYFDLTYDPTKLTEQDILSLSIFKEYPARII